jgi:hypothetical protein
VASHRLGLRAEEGEGQQQQDRQERQDLRQRVGRLLAAAALLPRMLLPREAARPHVRVEVRPAMVMFCIYSPLIM